MSARLDERRTAFMRGLSIAFLWPVLLLTLIVCFYVFRILNTLLVFGSQKRGAAKGLLEVSNHETLIDSFEVGLATYLPSLLLHPTLAPSHLADARNFMTHPILRFVYQALRVIPVKSTDDGCRNDIAAFRTAVRVLRDGGMMHIFIEGTRSPDDQLLPPKNQVGSIALLSGATVRPIFLTGGHKLFPYRKKMGDPPATWWRYLFGSQTEWLLDVRAGHRPVVFVGEEMTPEEILAIAGTGKHRDRAARVTAAIMDRIRQMQMLYRESTSTHA